MLARRWPAALLLSTLFTVGCGSPQEEGPVAQAENNAAAPAAAPKEVDPKKEALRGVTAKPDSAVTQFLTAIQKGDEELAEAMLTDLAREETKKMDMDVKPQGSPTARWEIGETEFVTEDKSGAHVASKWIDVDEEGTPLTDEIIWILRQEEHGWRIAGMATKIFDDELPLILNFEDPADMLRKQQLAQEEIDRRSQPAATTPATTGLRPTAIQAAQPNVQQPQR